MKLGRAVLRFLLAVVLLSVIASGFIGVVEAAMATDFTLAPSRVCIGSHVTFRLSFTWTGTRRKAVVHFYSTFINLSVGELKRTVYIEPGSNTVSFNVSIPWSTVPGKYVVRTRLEVYATPSEEKPFYTAERYFIVYIVRPPPPRVSLASRYVSPYTRSIVLVLENQGPCSMYYEVASLKADNRLVYGGGAGIKLNPGEKGFLTIPLDRPLPLKTTIMEIGLREYVEHRGNRHVDYTLRIPVESTGPGLEVVNRSAALPAESLEVPLALRNVFSEALRVRVAEARLVVGSKNVSVGSGGEAVVPPGKTGVLPLHLSLSGVKPGNYTLVLVLVASPTVPGAGSANISYALGLSLLRPPSLTISPPAATVELGRLKTVETKILNPSPFRLTIASITFNASSNIRLAKSIVGLRQAVLKPGEEVPINIVVSGLGVGQGKVCINVVYSDPFGVVHTEKHCIEIRVVKNIAGFMGDLRYFAAALVMAVAATSTLLYFRRRLEEA